MATNTVNRKGMTFIDALPAGNSQATATVLGGRQISVKATSTPAGSGYMLPASKLGNVCWIKDGDAANAVLIYPPVGAQINTLGVNNPDSLAAGSSATFVCTGATQWDS